MLSMWLTPTCSASLVQLVATLVRHFMVGLYPLHFVVNMTTLVFERYFSDTDIITIRGQIFHYNNVIIMALLTGLANLLPVFVPTILLLLISYTTRFFAKEYIDMAIQVNLTILLVLATM